MVRWEKEKNINETCKKWRILADVSILFSNLCANWHACIRNRHRPSRESTRLVGSARSRYMIIYCDPSLTDSTYEYALDDETACESVPLISADGRRTLIVNHFSRKPTRTGGPERRKNVDWRHKNVINPFICTFNINFYLLKIELNNLYFPLCTHPLIVLKSSLKY